MRNKRRNTNIKILQSQLQNLAVKEEVNNELPLNQVKLPISNQKIEVKGTGIELPIIEKLPKKKGIKKDELISTRRLLTMG
jgi:hypothetical protein